MKDIEGIEYDKELTTIREQISNDQELFIKSPELYVQEHLDSRSEE